MTADHSATNSFIGAIRWTRLRRGGDCSLGGDGLSLEAAPPGLALGGQRGAQPPLLSHVHHLMGQQGARRLPVERAVLGGQEDLTVGGEGPCVERAGFVSGLLVTDDRDPTCHRLGGGGGG